MWFSMGNWLKTKIWQPVLRELVAVWEVLWVLLVWMLIPITIFLGVSYYQAREDVVTNDTNQRAIENIPLSDNTILFVSYPKQLVYDATEGGSESISIWAQIYTPTITPTQNSASIVNTPIATPTAQEYLISILPDSSGNTFLFTDKDGRDVSPYMVLTPSYADVTPRVIYVQPNQVVATKSDLVVIGGENPVNLPIQIDDKGYKQRFADYLLAPFTGTAFLAGLVGFFIRQWQQSEERKEKAEQKRLDNRKKAQELKDSARQKAEELNELLKSNPSEAARQYAEEVHNLTDDDK